MLLTVGRYNIMFVKISEITDININRLLYCLCHSSSYFRPCKNIPDRSLCMKAKPVISKTTEANFFNSLKILICFVIIRTVC
jgi:hypothetical protein